MPANDSAGNTGENPLRRMAAGAESLASFNPSKRPAPASDQAPPEDPAEAEEQRPGPVTSLGTSSPHVSTDYGGNATTAALASEGLTAAVDAAHGLGGLAARGLGRLRDAIPDVTQLPGVDAAANAAREVVTAAGDLAAQAPRVVEGMGNIAGAASFAGDVAGAAMNAAGSIASAADLGAAAGVAKAVGEGVVSVAGAIDLGAVADVAGAAGEIAGAIAGGVLDIAGDALT
jgi:hypothetical protein